MIQIYIGSEVGDVATCSIWSDKISRLMITMCRRKICAPRYEVVYLILLYNTYDFLIFFNFWRPILLVQKVFLGSIVHT